MGVPALFRWLSKQYPKIVDDVKEAEPQKVDGVELPLDTSTANPNGIEFDNLYLDMNGIVHPCAHPENRPPPATEQEMMIEIFKYTERVVAMIRPRKLLFMAIDGVAPRAKMNQQRSRRFRAAQEAKSKDEDAANLLQNLKDSGKEISDDLQVTKTWDSNAITPGTPFMALLASSLRYWIAQKYATDPGWKNIKVILSDSSVPGEGEHKIMEFIRSQRASPSHDPNTQHVIYGLDADLIMLALATHEPYFRVLREDVFAQDSNSKGCRICGQLGHYADQCTGKPKEKEGDFGEKEKAAEKKPFIFLNVATLREYLEIDLDIKNIPFAFDLEKAIDDWVFLCFFVGNDFLPHLPSLEIREGAIDKLIAYWKRSLPLMNGYVTSDGNVNLERAQVIIDCLAKDEDYIFKSRREREERQEANNKRRKMESEARMARNGDAHSNGQAAASAPPQVSQKRVLAPQADSIPDLVPLNRADVDAMEKKKKAEKRQKERERQANLSAAARIKAELAAGDEASETAMSEADASQGTNEDKGVVDNDDKDASENIHGVKRKADELGEEESSQVIAEEDDDAMDHTTPQPKPAEPVENEDTVRLWEPGFKERYYRQKFGVELNDNDFRRNIVRSYVEGLAWALRYYFQGCPSWQWYYPYHYAPFASDFVDISSIKVKFDLGKPFKPYEQLMGVLPAASKHHLPKELNSLMTDEDSDILEYYPEDFPVDLNGKKFAWQGVVILPFIDEQRLLKAMKPRYAQLSEEDAARNEMGHDILYVCDGNKLYDVLCKLYGKRKSDVPVTLDPRVSLGLIGSVQRDPLCIPRSTLMNPLSDHPELQDIVDDASLSVYYYYPKTGFDHKSVLLKGLVMPSRVLTHADREFVKSGGASRGGRGGGHGGRPDDSRGRTGRYMSERQDHGGWQNGGVHKGNGGYQGNGGHHGQDGHGYGRGNNRGRSRGGYNGGYNGGYEGGYSDRGGSYGEPDYGRDTYGSGYGSSRGRGGVSKYGGGGGYGGYSSSGGSGSYPGGGSSGGYGSNRWDSGQYRTDNHGGNGGGRYGDYSSRYEEAPYDNGQQAAGGGYGGYRSYGAGATGPGGYRDGSGYGSGAAPPSNFQSPNGPPYGHNRREDQGHSQGPGYGQGQGQGQIWGGESQRGYGNGNGSYGSRGYY